jgi:hypothetical protein
MEKLVLVSSFVVDRMRSYEVIEWMDIHNITINILVIQHTRCYPKVQGF